MSKRGKTIIPPKPGTFQTKYLKEETINSRYKQAFKEPEHIIFSFKYLDLKDETFNVNKCDTKWFVQLLERKKSYCMMTAQETKQGGKSTRCHPIDWSDTCKSGFNIPNLSDDIEEYQLSISKANGRIIGFFTEHIFHVVWLDPEHKLYG